MAAQAAQRAISTLPRKRSLLKMTNLLKMLGKEIPRDASGGGEENLTIIMMVSLVLPFSAVSAGKESVSTISGAAGAAGEGHINK